MEEEEGVGLACSFCVARFTTFQIEGWRNLCRILDIRVSFLDNCNPE